MRVILGKYPLTVFFKGGHVHYLGDKAEFTGMLSLIAHYKIARVSVQAALLQAGVTP